MARLLWTQKEDIGPEARLQHAMAYDVMRERVVLFGGHIRTAPSQAGMNDTWEWDGESWTQMNDIGPAPRDCHAMAYDCANKRVLLFGGYPKFSDTWDWNGDDWTQVADTGPGPRMATAMASDSKRGRIVLFGGFDFSFGFLGDTWEWDGVEWIQAEDMGPPARAFHVMVYDPVRERILLFGGAGDINNLLSDTWVWDGNRWTEVQDIGPLRAYPAAASTADGAILFGGGLKTPRSPLPGVRDTWRWDGKHWSQRADIGPQPRMGHAMAYDSARQRIVLFGGASNEYLGDTWELFQSRPA